MDRRDGSGIGPQAERVPTPPSFLIRSSGHNTPSVPKALTLHCDQFYLFVLLKFFWGHFCFIFQSDSRERQGRMTCSKGLSLDQSRAAVGTRGTHPARWAAGTPRPVSATAVQLPERVPCLCFDFDVQAGCLQSGQHQPSCSQDTVRQLSQMSF